MDRKNASHKRSTDAITVRFNESRTYDAIEKFELTTIRELADKQADRNTSSPQDQFMRNPVYIN
jgi:hypothetical protein